MVNISLKLCVIAVMVFVTASCKDEAKFTPIIKSVSTVIPQQANAGIERVLSGVIQPVDSSVLSFEIPGIVNHIAVNLGDRFNQGDTLATIDNRVLKLALQQQKSQLLEIRARLEEAEIDFTRKSKLVASGALSQAELDIAKARYYSLQEQADIAKAQVALAQENLDDTKLVAPFTGRVATRHVEPSQQVSQTTPVLTLQGSDALEVSVLVPESMISQLRKNDSVYVDVWLKQKRERLNGTLFEVGQQAQQANAFPVTVQLNPDERLQWLQPGMSAEVEFAVDQLRDDPALLSAPMSAVAAGANNAHYVMALRAADTSGSFTVDKVAVEMVSMDSHNVLFKTSTPIEEIVRTGVDFLRDQQIVHKSNGFPRTINE